MNTNKWSRNELKAAVIAYLHMWEMNQNRIPFVKKEIYETLADEYGRTSKSYEYRMQNISYVFAQLGREWVTGLKPAKNVGSKVAKEIEALILELEQSHSPS